MVNEKGLIRYLHGCHNRPGVKPLSITEPLKYVAIQFHSIVDGNAVTLADLVLAKDLGSDPPTVDPGFGVVVSFLGPFEYL
jgi:hypothetical protein